MSKKTKNFFLFLCLFGLFFTSLPVNSVKAADTSWQWITVDSTWLSIDVGSFVDKSTNDGSGRFHIMKGGNKLVDFTNDGKISLDGDNITVWRARAEFEFTIDYFTTVGIMDAFPYANLNKIEKVKWLHLYKYAGYWLGQRVNPTEITAEIEYRTVDFDSRFWKISPGFRKHDYDGNVPITVNINPAWSGQEEFDFNGFIFKNPTVYAEIVEVEVKDIRYDIIGDYEDYYVGQDTVSGGVDVIEPDRNDPDIGEGSKVAKVNEILNSVGWEAGEYTYDITYPNGETKSRCGSSDQYNRDSTNSFTFVQDVRLKPGVTYTTQDIDINFASISWDYEDVWLSPSGVWVNERSTFEDTRVTSVHVDNRWIRQVFTVYVNLFLNAEPVPKEGGNDLIDPFVDSGDIVWNEDIGGTTNMTIVNYTPWQTWWDNVADWWSNLGFGFMSWVIPILFIVGIGFLIFISLPYLPVIIPAISRIFKSPKKSSNSDTS